jgi:hypothetical protein
MKVILTIVVLLVSAGSAFSQNNANPNYQPAPTSTDVQKTVAQPQNLNVDPQREIIVPQTQQNIPPPQVAIPAPSQNNASYQDNSQFYNKDNTPSTETNKVPSSNGTYSQPSYSNPNNKPSTQ